MNSRLSELYFTFVDMTVYDAQETCLGSIKHIHFADDKFAIHIPELATKMETVVHSLSESHPYIIGQGFILVADDEFVHSYIIPEEQIAAVGEESVYLNVCSKDLLVC